MKALLVLGLEVPDLPTLTASIYTKQQATFHPGVGIYLVPKATARPEVIIGPLHQITDMESQSELVDALRSLYDALSDIETRTAARRVSGIKPAAPELSDMGRNQVERALRELRDGEST